MQPSGPMIAVSKRERMEQNYRTYDGTGKEMNIVKFVCSSEEPIG